MEDILYCKDLYIPICDDGKQPADITDNKKWEVMNRKTVGQIRQWVGQSVFHHEAKETNAYTLWQKLEAMYERKTAQNKASLIRKIVNLKYKDGHSVTEHMSNFQGVINQLTTMKMVLDDEMQALLLLSSLPDSWDTLVVSLSNSAPQGKLTMAMVEDSMLNEEARRKEQGISFESEALVTERRGRSKSRRPQNREKSRDKSKGKFKSKIECYHCGKHGHIKRECRQLKRELAKENTNEKTEDTTATTLSGDDMFIVCGDNYVNITTQDTYWVIDSGASFHVTSRRDFFTSYTDGDYGQVRMGNDHVSKIVGMGEICLETNTNCRLVLKDVRHVPDMRLNLISTGVLDDEGYKNEFYGGKWKLSKGSLVLARGKKESTLYSTQAKVSRGDVNSLSNNSSIEL